MLKSVVMSSAALAAMLALAPSAAAFDCAKASTDTEKAICADPAVKAADDEMAAAYAALLPLMQGDQAAMLKANQRAWLKVREMNCGWQEEAADKAACLLEVTQLRTRYLSAAPASGPGFGDSPRLVPHLYARDFGKGHCSADVSVYRFAGPAADRGEKAFNGWIDALTANLENDYGAYAEGDLPEDMQCDYGAAGDITYASADLVAMTVSITMFGGGAHGMSTATAITLDRNTGKVLAFADLFAPAAAKQLTTVCAEEIKAEKLKRFAEYEEDKAAVAKLVADDLENYAEAIAEGVGDLSNWQVYEDRAEVYFPPYALGSYAEGDYVCRLPKAALEKAAGDKGWIVP